MAEVVLKLDDLVDRAIVRIGETPYEMKNAEELSILDFHAIGKHGQKVARLMATPDLSDDDVTTLHSALRVLVAIILIAPPEILDRLNDMQRVAIAETFTRLQDEKNLKTATPTVEQSEETETPSTGENSSQD